MNETEKSSIKLFLLKTLIVVAGIGALLLIGASSMIFLISTLTADTIESEDDLVYVIDLQGEISSETAYGMGNISPKNVRQQLEQINENTNAQAVVLRINSPGGTVAASQEIASIIDDYDLPVVTSMADTATSGGYYIASAADQVIAQHTSTTGSIGVISVIYNMEELYENIGIEVEVIKSGEYKDMGFESLTDKEREIVKELSDEMYDHFVSEVAHFREEMNQEEVYDIATGEIMTGSKAHEIGLVDSLGGLEAAVNQAGELAGIEDPNMRRLEPGTTLEGIFAPLMNNNDLLNKIFSPAEVKKYEHIKELPALEFRYQENFNQLD